MHRNRLPRLRHFGVALAALTLAACATTSEMEPWQRAPAGETAVPTGPAAPTPAPDSQPAATPGTTPDAAPTSPAAGAAEAATGGAATTAGPTSGGMAFSPDQYPDLLERIRAGFRLDDPDHRAIDAQLAWYARNPEYLERVFGRAELYMHHIVTEVERRGMPLELALLPVIESAFEPYAFSRSAASGLWQFVPGTGTRFGLPQNWWYDGRRDVLESTRAALDYLQFLHDEFDGDWLLAVAGYNCGEACVARARRVNAAAGRPTDFFSLRLPAETRAYVPKLLAMKRLVESPETYGIAFSPIANEPYFARVDLDGQIDLKVAAELAGIPHESLFELNPAFHRWATPPQGPHHLLLPIDAADLFRQNLAQLTPDERMRVTHHVVRRGETLAAVARQYGAQPLEVRMLNDLGNGPLVAGTDLRVPSGATQLPAKVLRAAALVDGRAGRRGTRRPVIHVVRRGESLWAIARRNNMDPRTLMRMNNKQPGDKLRAGERLVVSRAAAPSTPRASSSRVDRASGSASERTVRHTVRSGDTLYRIARLYQVTVAQIVSWNGIAATTTLRPGMKLTINIRRGR